jgi:hypothetical protein
MTLSKLYKEVEKMRLPEGYTTAMGAIDTNVYFNRAIDQVLRLLKNYEK